MQVANALNNSIRILFNPKVEAFKLFDFLMVKSDQDRYLAQIIEIYDDKFDSYAQYRDEGFMTICGHGPEDEISKEGNGEKGFLRIDTGCGHRKVKLTLLRIEKTGEIKFKYIKAQEDDDFGEHN